MEELRTIFGEESLTFDAFQEKLTASGMKLADISKGEYIGKGKYDKLSADFAKYKSENDISKYADYDTLKAENETLKAEKLENEQMNILASKNVGEKFRKFVLTEIKANVNGQKDFDTALTEYLAENEQFITKKEEPKNTTGFFRFGSQVDVANGTKPAESAVEKFNNQIRGVK